MTLYNRTIEMKQEVVRGEKERALEARFCWAVARDLRGQVEERRARVVVEQETWTQQLLPSPSLTEMQ